MFFCAAPHIPDNHELVDDPIELVDAELIDDLDKGGGCRGDRATSEGGPGLSSLFLT